MVIERVYGTPVDEVEQLRAQGISMKLLGERGVEIFFTQVFRDNFFHADMQSRQHLRGARRPLHRGRLRHHGDADHEDQRYLAENLLAFFHRDYRRVAELHVESGWVPRTTRIDEFESAIRTVCEPIWEKPLSEISFGALLLRLFQVARRFDMEVQPQLVLLQKTLLNIEGLGRMPLPAARSVDHREAVHGAVDARERVGPAGLPAPGAGVAARAVRAAAGDAQLAYRRARRRRRGPSPRALESPDLEGLRRDMRRHNRRTVGAVTGGSLLLVGVA